VPRDIDFWSISKRRRRNSRLRTSAPEFCCWLQPLGPVTTSYEDVLVQAQELYFVIPAYPLRDVGETVEQYEQHFWKSGHTVSL
jgi:hypothetical protein